MKFSQSFKLAIKSIMSSKIRSLLTMLGIIIGVAAVIIIVGLGNGMQKYMQKSFFDLGTNTLNVYLSNYNSSKKVTPDDMFDIARDNHDYIDGISPTISIGGNIRIEKEKAEKTQISGVAESFDKMSNLKVVNGRFLEYMDMQSTAKVCVIGSFVNEKYFNSNAIGKIIKIDGNPYKVVGVLEMKAKNQERGDDNKIYVPYTTAMKASYQSDVGSYVVSVKDSNKVDTAKNILSTKLTNIYGSKDKFNILSMAEMLDSMNQMINVMVAILASIAAISLFVGGIGIMNIMLVSVSERTREIGIRKALGATNGNILTQFVIEAGTTSAMGGLLGIGLGYALSQVGTIIINAVLKQEIIISPSSSAVLISFGISFAIGVIFGYLPARKAAKLNPIDALRYE